MSNPLGSSQPRPTAIDGGVVVALLLLSGENKGRSLGVVLVVVLVLVEPIEKPAEDASVTDAAVGAGVVETADVELLGAGEVCCPAAPLSRSTLVAAKAARLLHTMFVAASAAVRGLLPSTDC